MMTNLVFPMSDESTENTSWFCVHNSLNCYLLSLFTMASLKFTLQLCSALLYLQEK